MNKKINYIGWIGHNNLGDEAIYLACKKIFKNYSFINKEKVYKYSINILGGGTLLPRWTYSTQVNKFNYGIGLGVRKPTFWGKFDKYFIESIKNYNFRYLGVRGFESQKTLKKWGIKSEVIGDIALSLKPTRFSNSPSNLVIINAGISDEGMWGNNSQHVFNELVKVCRYLKSHNYDVLVLPFWEKDVQYCKELAKTSGTKILEDWNNVQKTLDIISNAHILIGVKLHSLVLSAAAHVPFISLEYRPKCYDFVNSVGFDDFNIRVDKMNSVRIINKFNLLSKRRNSMKKLLKSYVLDYRKKINKFTENIKNDINKIPEKDLYIQNPHYEYLKDIIKKNYYRFTSNKKKFALDLIKKLR